MKYFTRRDLPNKDLDSLLTNPLVHTELEIGTYAGEFICDMAESHPDRFFVGVEISSSLSRRGAERASRKFLSNVCIINIEAQEYLSKWVPDRAFYTIHIYFPTPYKVFVGFPPRLVYPLNRPQFIEEAYRVLKLGGALRLVTDEENYYETACKCFESGRWWAVDWQPLPLAQKDNQFVGTPHEIRYREENRTMYALQLIRRE